MPDDWAGNSRRSRRSSHRQGEGPRHGDDPRPVGAFMKQAGGWIVPRTPGRRVQHPHQLRASRRSRSCSQGGLLTSYPRGGRRDRLDDEQAFGQGKAAMTIEGNWIKGALNDYPKVKWQAVELPAGPAAKGTLSFTECYGVAAARQEPGGRDRPRQVAHHDRPADGLRRRLRRHAVHRGRGQGLRGQVPRVAGLRRRRAVRPGPGQPARLRRGDGRSSTPSSATMGKGGDPNAWLEELQKNGTAALAG